MKPGDKVKYIGFDIEGWNYPIPEINKTYEIKKIVALNNGNAIGLTQFVHSHTKEPIYYPEYAFELIDGNTGERAPNTKYIPYGESIYLHRVESPNQPHMR